MNTAMSLKEQLFYRIPPEVVTCRCSSKYVFLEVLHTSQQSICTRVNFWKTCRLEACNFITKDFNTVVFLGSFRNTFSYWTPSVTACHLRWLLLYFFKKVLLNSYLATLLWHTISFFSTNCLMYTKLNLFVYKFWKLFVGGPL